MSKRSRNYLVMEWVEGRPLRQILADCGPARLPEERARRIAGRICEALDYLHNNGVVHRDLKPENVLIGAGDEVKLIDFGIASMTGTRRLTFGKLSQVMGTPDYISPEQVKGKRGDARSDIYAMGVILYEMLTGTTPFSGDNPFAVMNLRLTQSPRPAYEVNPALPSGLQEILRRALEPDPKNRYATARELSCDLQHANEIAVRVRPVERKSGSLAEVWRFTRLALVPLSIVAILLYAARHT